MMAIDGLISIEARLLPALFEAEAFADAGDPAHDAGRADETQFGAVVSTAARGFEEHSNAARIAVGVRNRKITLI